MYIIYFFVGGARSGGIFQKINHTNNSTSRNTNTMFSLTKLAGFEPGPSLSDHRWMKAITYKTNYELPSRQKGPSVTFVFAISRHDANVAQYD
jgi:hypothetical protein